MLFSKLNLPQIELFIEYCSRLFPMPDSLLLVFLNHEVADADANATVAVTPTLRSKFLPTENLQMLRLTIVDLRFCLHQVIRSPLTLPDALSLAHSLGLPQLCHVSLSSATFHAVKTGDFPTQMSTNDGFGDSGRTLKCKSWRLWKPVLTCFSPKFKWAETSYPPSTCTTAGKSSDSENSGRKSF